MGAGASAAGTSGSSRLRALARRGAEEAEGARERCDLCGEPIPAEHRHLLDASSRELKCVCQPCRILFDRREAGGGHFRLVPDRRLRIDDFELDDRAWDALRIPVDMAFFFPNSAEKRVVAFYPGPMGATESLLELRAWREIEAANPVLGGLEPDVEALLVNRAMGAREHFLVPIDDCYALVGLIRTRWKGLTGGREVWDEIGRFFEALGARARTGDRLGERDEREARTARAAAGGEEL